MTSNEFVSAHSPGPESLTSSSLEASELPAGAFSVRKLFDDLPCCHRSWTHQGKCAFLHGYERSFELEFACTELAPDTGFVVDFGDLKSIRAILNEQFDHTTLIAAGDPELETFKSLHEKGVVDLRVMPNTGMEGSARWVYATCGEEIRRRTDGRVWVTRVEARETRKNAVILRAEPGR